jgi:hypothetical protein
MAVLEKWIREMLNVARYEIRRVLNQFTLDQNLNQMERRVDEDEGHAQNEFNRAVERFQQNAEDEDAAKILFVESRIRLDYLRRDSVIDAVRPPDQMIAPRPLSRVY